MYILDQKNESHSVKSLVANKDGIDRIEIFMQLGEGKKGIGLYLDFEQAKELRNNINGLFDE